ncbi:hypothetical protein [Trichormus azollae]|uniref:hypothetical protein n=1 Tax=Trichormus azollae TaxID=1164 RepID=UPI00325C62AC
MFVEHVIRLVKIFRVAQQRFPLNSRIYEVRIQVEARGIKEGVCKAELTIGFC